MPEPQQVEVYNPQGKLGTIPSAQLEQAKAAGYKSKSDFMEAVHPKTGKTGIIPKEQWAAAQKQGYVLSPREQLRAKAKTGMPMTPSYSAMAVGHTPGGADPHNPGNPNLNALPPEMREAVSTSLAKTQAGVLAGQGAGAIAGKAFAPTITSETVPTGILDMKGKELVRDVMKYGPSSASKAISHPAVQKILRWVAEGAVGGGVLRMLESVGKK